MTFLDAFARVAARRPDEAGQLQGLDLAESVIDDVILTIEHEREDLDPSDFEHKGHIAAGSFGGGDRAPALALHHTRAHGVTADTLAGVVTDLQNFQQACRLARQAIVDADQDVSDRLRYTQLAVDQLAYGASTDHAERANRQAQYDHRNDRPTEGPEEQA